MRQLILMVEPGDEDLPVHQNTPSFIHSFLSGGTYVIKHDDRYFEENQIPSKGKYVIGCHSHMKVSYTISIHLVRHDNPNTG